MRKLAAGILLLALLAGGVLVAVRTRALPPQVGPAPPLGPTLAGRRVGADAPVAASHPVQVIFADASAAWDWDNACEEALARFIDRHGFPVTRLLVTLTDDADLPLGAAVPNAEAPEALAFGQCEEVNDALACRAAVAQGEPGEAVDTAVASVMAYAVQEQLRVKTEAAWQAKPAWEWADFAPLLRKEDDGWRSACVTLYGG